MSHDSTPRCTARPTGRIELDPEFALAGEAPSLLVLRHRPSAASPFLSSLVDLSTWPPVLTRLDETLLVTARSDGGRWLVVSRTPRSPSRWRVRVSCDPDGDRTALLPAEEREEGVSWAAFLGERVVAVAGFHVFGSGADARLPTPLIEERGKLVPIEGLSRAAGDYPTFGATRLADGTQMLFWNGNGYAYEGGRFRLAYQLEAETPTHLWTTVPLAAGGFLYLSKGRLHRARMGQDSVALLPEVDDILRMAPGPDGGVVLTRGGMGHGNVGAVYLLEEGALIDLPPELFGIEEPAMVHGLHWCEACGCLVATTCTALYASPLEAALGLARRRADGP